MGLRKLINEWERDRMKKLRRDGWELILEND